MKNVVGKPMGHLDKPEFREFVSSERLKQLPDIWLDCAPMYTNTHSLADDNWCVQIISQRKRRRHSNGYPLKGYYDMTRITFFPHQQKYAGNKHSSVRFKLPFFAETIEEVWNSLIADADCTGKSSFTCRFSIDLKMHRADADPNADALKYITDNYSLADVLDAFYRKDAAKYPARRKPKGPPPDMSNVIDMRKWIEPKPVKLLSQTEIRELVRKIAAE